MNVKFGIMKRRMLTLFVDQSINSLGITDLNQKVHLFNQTIKKILCNFIPSLLMIEIPHGSKAK